MADILEYLKNVESCLTKGNSPASMKNSLFPVKMLIELNCDQLLDSEELNRLNETIRSYIAQGEENYLFDDDAEVLDMLKDILNIKLQKSPMCTGRNNELPPHKADPVLFAKRGVCSNCLLEDGTSHGVKKGAKKIERNDMYRENIIKCMDDVLEGYDRKDLEKILKSEEITSGEELYHKIKSISMSKTDGNWSKLRDKIQRDIIKLGTAYGVNAIAYVYNPTLKKLEKLGEIRESCKEMGRQQCEGGRVINTFTIAENHITSVLMNVKIEAKPTKRQAYEATKVLKSLSAVGVSNLSTKKTESKFVNSEDFNAQYGKWMDQLEKDGELKDDRTDEDSSHEDDANKENQEQSNEEDDYGSNIILNNQVCDDILEEAYLQVAESAEDSLSLNQGIGVDAHKELTILSPTTRESSPPELFTGRVIASNNNVKRFVADEDISLMASFTKNGRNRIIKPKFANKKFALEGENRAEFRGKRESGHKGNGPGKTPRLDKARIDKSNKKSTFVGQGRRRDADDEKLGEESSDGSTMPSIITNQSSVISIKPSVIKSRPSVISSQQSFISSQPSVISSQPSVISSQPSFISSQPSFISSQLSFQTKFINESVFRFADNMGPTNVGEMRQLSKNFN